jgi:hypothetical protein
MQNEIALMWQTASPACPSRRPDANSARVACGPASLPRLANPMRVIDYENVLTD